MNPMYTAMMNAQDPLAAQQAQVANFKPPQVQQLQQSGIAQALAGVQNIAKMGATAQNNRNQQVQNWSNDPNNQYLMSTM